MLTLCPYPFDWWVNDLETGQCDWRHYCHRRPTSLHVVLLHCRRTNWYIVETNELYSMCAPHCVFFLFLLILTPLSLSFCRVSAYASRFWWLSSMSLFLQHLDQRVRLLWPLSSVLSFHFFVISSTLLPSSSPKISVRLHSSRGWIVRSTSFFSRFFLQWHLLNSTAYVNEALSNRLTSPAVSPLPVPDPLSQARQSVSHPPRLLCQMFHAYIPLVLLCLSLAHPSMLLSFLLRSLFPLQVSKFSIFLSPKDHLPCYSCTLSLALPIFSVVLVLFLVLLRNKTQQAEWVFIVQRSLYASPPSSPVRVCSMMHKSYGIFRPNGLTLSRHVVRWYLQYWIHLLVLISWWFLKRFVNASSLRWPRHRFFKKPFGVLRDAGRPSRHWPPSPPLRAILSAKVPCWMHPSRRSCLTPRRWIRIEPMTWSKLKRNS